jgi:hypothetical protein
MSAACPISLVNKLVTTTSNMASPDSFHGTFFVDSSSINLILSAATNATELKHMISNSAFTRENRTNSRPPHHTTDQRLGSPTSIPSSPASM